MGSTLRRLKIYYINNFRVTRHGLWLIAGVSLLLMIASRLFDYRPTAFYEVCVLTLCCLTGGEGLQEPLSFFTNNIFAFKIVLRVFTYS